MVVGAGMFNGGFLSANPGATYRVSEVPAVRSLSAFDCKLSDYAYAPSVRFRVQIRDVTVNPDIPPEEAAEYLSERLNSAERILLTNVNFRNYFRVTADVVADGRDLGQEFIRRGLAATMEPPVDETDAGDMSRQALRTKSIGRQYRPKQTRHSRPAGPPVRQMVVTMQSLMDSWVDLSMINDETPLEEALNAISDSVRPRLPFVILWNDLEANAFVDKNTPIGVSEFGNVQVKQALKVILHSISVNAPTKVILAIEGGVVTVGTQRGLIQKMAVHSYSVDDLVTAPFTENINTLGGLVETASPTNFQQQNH